MISLLLVLQDESPTSPLWGRRDCEKGVRRAYKSFCFEPTGYIRSGISLGMILDMAVYLSTIALLLTACMRRTEKAGQDRECMSRGHER